MTSVSVQHPEGYPPADIGERGGLSVRLATRWSDLVDDVVQAVHEARPDDPFATMELVVRGPAARRALSQAIATRTGTASDRHAGICAGIDFPTLAGVHRRVQADLAHLAPERDPWRRRPLTLTVLSVLHASVGDQRFAPVAHHLLHPAASGGTGTDDGEQRPGRWMATADRIARLMLGYVRDAPGMLRSWTGGTDVDPGGDVLGPSAAWQPAVWRACRELLSPVDDPVTRHDRLLQFVADGRAIAGLRDSLLLVDPGPMTAFEHEFLAAVARVRPVTVWMLAPAGMATPWGERLGQSARAQMHRLLGPDGSTTAVGDGAPVLDTVLHRLQANLLSPRRPAVTGVRPAPDGTVQVHASHGPDRQVEVLREVLCALFVESPTLEPRDVVVVCPRLDEYAPLVRAAFGTRPHRADDEEVPRAGRHPGTELRVQVAASGVDEANPAFDLLRRLLLLPVSRATAQDFVDLCSSPLVATRFSLDPDDLDALARLLHRAETHWGVDAAHRARFGLAAVRQSTWLVGIERMLVGVALADRPPGWLDTVVPVPQVSSRHLPAIGAAAEILSRVRRILGVWQTPAPMSEWSRRLVEALDALTSPGDGDTARVLAHARAELAALAELTAGADVAVSRGDLRSHFDRLVHVGAGRPNHGNGSLLVTRLDDLDDVGHRVVVVLGLDDATVPPPVRHDGDNLVPDRTLPESGVRAASLRSLHSAIAAATDTLVVIHQGRDPRSNEPVPTTPVLAELVEACAAVGGATHREHTLLPESETNFLADDDEPPVSFDPVALRGARALDARLRRSGPRPRTAPSVAPPWEAGTPVQLDDLLAFFRNPARALLRNQLGVSLDSYAPVLDETLPVEADGLVRWRVGTALLEAELQGLDVDRAEKAQHLSGVLPPPARVGALVDDIRGRADRVADAVRRCTSTLSGEQTAAVSHRVDLDLTHLLGGPLSGDVVLHGRSAVSWRYGSVRWQELVPLWIRLLAVRAAAAADPPDTASPLQGVAIGTNGVFRLTPPDPGAAAALLAEMMGVRGRGLRRVLPLPVELVNARRPLLSASQRDPEGEARAEWARVCERPEWQMTLPYSYRELMRLPPDADDPGVPEPSRVEQLTSWLTVPVLTGLRTERLP
ncbi:MAG TPA: exodeoxyribonuclease V subunit gamma [Propionibacteriaceae bacterium]|nr:exodeoxyribonuclease V subunit gamma [Propionibacteriaceae bacterium]